MDANEEGTGRGTLLVPVYEPSGTLSANGKAAGSATLQDAESNLLVPIAFSAPWATTGRTRTPEDR
jgi:hypothetical protein